MTTLRAAAERAIEALDLLAKSEHPATNFTTKSGGRIYPHKVAVDAGVALRTALSEPEQDEHDLTTVYMAGRMDERKAQRTEPVQDDTALLRQCMEALINTTAPKDWVLIKALRERLKEST
jgi:hypothetical protein